MSTKDKAKYITLMILCKIGSTLLSFITLGIPQAIKFLTKKYEEYQAKINGDIKENQKLAHKGGLDKYHVRYK